MKWKLLLIAFVMVFQCAAQPDTTAYRLAQKLNEQEKYSAALTAINRAISSRATADYYSLRGQIYYNLDKRQEAITDFTQAIHLQPKDYRNYTRRGLVFYSIQNPNLAIDDYTMALQLVGSNDSARYSILLNRGGAQAMRRDFATAYEDYQQVLRYDSNSFGALNNIGAVLDELGRRSEGMVYLQKLIRLYPDFKGGYINLSFQYVDLGEYQKALELSDKAISIDPNEALSYNNRGYIKYKLNDWKGALADINKSLKMYPTNSYAFRNRALVYLAQKQYEKACADLKEAVTQGFTDMYGNEVEKLLEQYCSQN